MTNFNKYLNPVLVIDKFGIIKFCNEKALECFEWKELENKSCLCLIEDKFKEKHRKLFGNIEDNNYYSINIQVNVLSEYGDSNLWNMNILPYEEKWVLFFSEISYLQQKLDKNLKLNNFIQSYLDHELKQKFAGISLSIENILEKNKDNTEIIIKKEDLNELLFLSNRGKELCFNSILQRQIFNDTYEISKTYFPIIKLYNNLEIETEFKSNNPEILKNLNNILLNADWNLIHHIVDNTIVNAKTHGYDINIIWEINENNIKYNITNKILNVKKYEKSNGIGKEIIEKCIKLLEGTYSFEINNNIASFEFIIPNNNEIKFNIVEKKLSPINLIKNNIKIFVLDDENIMRKTSYHFIKNTLNCIPYIFGEKSEDCENIKKIINEINPDIVLLDENLTYFDKVYKGSIICKELKEEGFSNPIIIRSAYDDVIKETYFKKMGADGFIKKSLNLQQLKYEINKIYYEFYLEKK